ncbi:MAG: thermonuclease family protein [Nitrosomonadales bacterium]|nr:thermonuclease family protein [Nitrosomonadales bacterium]
MRCLACALLFIGGVAQAADFSGKVIAVLDGDTLLVLRGGKPVKVRLAGIDAPEKAQPYGVASQQSLADLVMDKQIGVVSRAVDDYGRLVATVSIGEINVNHEQVRRGMAWEYSRFHNNHEVLALQRDAQQAMRGLWAGEAIAPAQWRKQHPAGFVPQHSPIGAPDGAACGDKTHCSEMTSCEEARHYLAKCGVETMDGDGDGVPCEALCAPQ